MGDPGTELEPAAARASLAAALAERGADRLDAILDAPDPKALVGAMEPTEVFFTFAQVDEEGKRALVRLLADEQLDYLLDLDLWSADRLDAERVMEWLERLWGADEDLAAAWLHRAESELVVTVLKQLCAVTEGPFSSQDSMTEDQDRLPPFTAEGKFFIQFLSDRAATLLRSPLLLLASADLEYYLALLQDVLAVPGPEAEEAAYRQRWSRLRDKGFVPADEAYEIYRWPTAEELAGEGGPAPAPGERPADDDASQPTSGAPSALALAPPRGLLAAAISSLEEPATQALSRAIAIASSRVLAADHLPFADLGAHRRALEKTLGYIAIGLHGVARGQPDRARDALGRQGAMTLFRAGYAQVAALGRRATALRRLGWLSQLGLGLDVLDEPLGDVVKALARPRPLYPAAALDGEKADREFRDPAEVERCAQALATVEALKRLFIDGLGLDLAPSTTFELEGCIPSNPAELSLGLILRTAMAQLLIDDRLRYAPVPAARLGALARTVRGLEGSGIERHVIQALGAKLESPSDDELLRISAFVVKNFDALATAFAGLDLDRGVDPRFIGAVVVRT
jgi:hypothetical protein